MERARAFSKSLRLLLAISESKFLTCQFFPRGDDDVSIIVLDPLETILAFDWRAAVSFEDTIKKQLAWYDQYGVSDIFSHLTARSG